MALFAQSLQKWVTSSRCVHGLEKISSARLSRRNLWFDQKWTQSCYVLLAAERFFFKTTKTVQKVSFTDSCDANEPVYVHVQTISRLRRLCHDWRSKHSSARETAHWEQLSLILRASPSVITRPMSPIVSAIVDFSMSQNASVIELQWNLTCCSPSYWSGLVLECLVHSLTVFLQHGIEFEWVRTWGEIWCNSESKFPAVLVIALSVQCQGRRQMTKHASRFSFSVDLFHIGDDFITSVVLATTTMFCRIFWWRWRMDSTGDCICVCWIGIFLQGQSGLQISSALLRTSLWCGAACCATLRDKAVYCLRIW